jgi:RNA-directed DNA polymerase
LKRYGNLFEKIISVENLLEACKKAKRGKLKQTNVQKFLKNEKQNLESLHELLKHKKYKTPEYKIFKIYDPKERNIFRLPFRERVVQHAIMNVLEPIFTRMFIKNTYSCVKGRGILKASMDLRKYLKDVSGTEYCLKLDIKKFYPSINNSILKEIIRRKIKDKNLLWLLDDIVDSAEGLPIGNYTSQIFSNLYLTYFDHFLKEDLKVEKYLRYADDLVILNSSKIELQFILNKIELYFKNLDLQVKNNKQIFPVDKRGIDWVGYVHYHTHTLIRKSIKQNYKKSKNKERYWGWIKHCNSINLRNKYELNYEKRD